MTISGLPSESKSPTAAALGFDPVANSKRGAKEMDPTVLVFSKTETLELKIFVTITSGFPLPFKSAIVTP